jgi:hypothetical protein
MIYDYVDFLLGSLKKHPLFFENNTYFVVDVVYLFL